jgi:hypothetical protein
MMIVDDVTCKCADFITGILGELRPDEVWHVRIGSDAFQCMRFDYSSSVFSIEEFKVLQAELSDPDLYQLIKTRLVDAQLIKSDIN